MHHISAQAIFLWRKRTLNIKSLLPLDRCWLKMTHTAPMQSCGAYIEQFFCFIICYHYLCWVYTEQLLLERLGHTFLSCLVMILYSVVLAIRHLLQSAAYMWCLSMFALFPLSQWTSRISVPEAP